MCLVGWALHFQKGMPLTSETKNRTEAGFSTERLHKTAELIANGELPIPMDWPVHHLSALLDLVHDSRRRKLVRYFSRLIAKDICRRKSAGETNNVET